MPGTLSNIWYSINGCFFSESSFAFLMGKSGLISINTVSFPRWCYSSSSGIAYTSWLMELITHLCIFSSKKRNSYKPFIFRRVSKVYNNCMKAMLP